MHRTDRQHAIIKTNAEILSIGIVGKKTSAEFDQNAKFFNQENAYENIVCEMAAILSREDDLTQLLLRQEYYG